MSLIQSDLTCIIVADCVIIMIGGLTNEARCLSLKENVKYHAQTERIHFDRAFSSNSHYCFIDGDTNAGTKSGEETGIDGSVPVEPPSVEPFLFDVYG